jgi:hypothetical protein
LRVIDRGGGRGVGRAGDQQPSQQNYKRDSHNRIASALGASPI